MDKASTDSRDEELRLLRKGAARAYRKGHHDTCSHSLVSVMECDCGFAELAEALHLTGALP